jgi:hypothetical protein
MAQSLVFVGSEAFALGSRITFGTLDFLTTSTDELCFSTPTVLVARPGPTRSTRSKVEKWPQEACRRP